MSVTATNRPADDRRAQPQATAAKAGLGTASMAALGIVFGDLGTSPLYTMQTVVGTTGGKVTPEIALGVLSLIFWALLITISVKYCLLVMRADNHGEGGILALIYGDGIITPAISVLSALEGVNVATPLLKAYVLPGAVVVLVALFAGQAFGTAKIGKVFG